MEINLASLG
jgi:hypothetical protein